jgi:K+-transporting ATPase A subunit
MKKFITTVLMLMVTMQLFAQGEGSVIADTLEGSEKIYVVVACVAIILLGLLLFLFSIERRLKKLEKKSSDKIMF